MKKNQIKRSLAIALLLLSHLSQAQVRLIFSDENSGSPIEGVVVAISSLSGNETAQAISLPDGSVQTEVSPPFIFETHHLGFENRRDTVYQNDDLTIFLNPRIQSLEEVVITGQYEPRSARQSVYKVRSINSDRIQSQGAVSLQNVLSNELNIRFSRDNATGSAGLNMQGLSGQYTKILLNGVPLTGRSGVSNEIDLNQINVQEIQRIEIVEGPMAVNYGADALAGVINIITKQDIRGQFDLNVTLQEETVGDEYNLFSDGIHSPSVKIGYKPAKNWYTQLNGRVNRFGGWKGTRGDARGKDWYPKTQYFGGGLVRFEKENFNISYGLDYLDETIEKLDSNVVDKGLKEPYAIDEEYLTTRLTHQLKGGLSIGKATLDAVVSYSDYERVTHQYQKNLVIGKETTTNNADEQDTIYYQSLFFRQTLNNALSGKWGSFQLGVDGTLETAGGTTLNDGDKHLTDIGVFTSAEFIIGKLKIRPGFRYTFNSIFEATPTPSVNLKYQLNKLSQVRLSYGRGFRAPSIRELYHEFIDSNHNILGNEKLQPEHSHSFNGDFSHNFNKSVSFSSGVFYNVIDNQITYFTPTSANQPTSYINLLKYKTIGTTLRGNHRYKNLTTDAGISYIGLYQRLEANVEEVPKFVFSWEANLNLQYAFGQTGWAVSTFYKYNGAQKNYQLDTEDNPYLTKLNAFHFIDAVVSKSIQKTLTIRGGVKNLLNVTSVNNSNTGGDVHGSGTRQTPMAYGRSYFLQLNYYLTK